MPTYIYMVDFICPETDECRPVGLFSTEDKAKSYISKLPTENDYNISKWKLNPTTIPEDE